MPADPNRVRDLFLAAADRPPADRPAFLANACGPDAELRAAVDRLLAAHDDPASVLESGAVVPEETGAYPANADGPDPAAGRPGTTIGPYKLLHQIGEGGMGTVWMAEQQTPVRRKVALKLIKAGFDSRQVIARFELERQALALMDHGNIAKVFDAGTTARGHPYFVMELIQGAPITQYCDEHHLTPHERLELFVPVCQAVQHAHQKGIIHRDLKPSNVLVTRSDGRPVPKVIDFGVAKVLHQRPGDDTLSTEFGQVLGTPMYMAPEQADLSPPDVDTRADVYSLGVMLYELLTGTTPLEKKRLKQAAVDEMLRLIREEEPPKPSTRLSDSVEALPSIAANRRTEPAKLSKLVRGELDWIVMKCLEKDRGRRYETANGLMRDIQRHLADEPVEACPPGAAYRLRKLARRYRGALVTAGAFAGLLLAAAAVSTWQAVRATRAEGTALTARDAEAKQRVETERQRDDANEQRRRTRAALDDMLSEESLAFLTTQKELLPPQRAFLERALKYYQEFADRAATEEEGLMLVGRARFRVGRIYQTLKKSTEAEAALRAAVTVQEKLSADFPTVLDHRRDLAQSHGNLGTLLASLKRGAEAEAAFRAVLAVQEKLAADFPAAAGDRRTLAAAHTNLGDLFRGLGRHAEAEAALRPALAVQEKLAADFPDVPAYRRDLAIGHNNLGNLLLDLSRRGDAEASYRTALAVREKLVEDFPAAPAYRRDLAHSHFNLGGLLAGQRKLSDAEAAYRAALALYERLAAELPAMPDYRQDVARTYTNLGNQLAAQGKSPETAIRTALAGYESLAADFPAVPDYRSDLARGHYNLGILLYNQGKLAEAEAAYRAALAQRERLATDFPAVLGYRRDLAENYYSLGVLLNRSRQVLAAVSAFQSAVSVQEKLVADFPVVPGYRSDLARTYIDLGMAFVNLKQRAEAEAAHRAALAVQEGLANDFPGVVNYAVVMGNGWNNFGELYRVVWDEPAASLDWYAKAIEAMRPIQQANPQDIRIKNILFTSHLGRARAFAQLNRPDEARAEFGRAAEFDDPTHPRPLRLTLAQARARTGALAQAIAVADEYVTRPDLTSGELYSLACVYALAAAGLPPDDADRAGARAIAMLRQSFIKGNRNVSVMLKDPDLDALRRRADYADLLWDLADGLVP